ncbi:tail fiber domain-containing protein [Chitinophaga barathri]|uniref:Tail fiber domain-containing protein n=1 Tax=Chitinophaga barathri TaxID=1647451 RepID=A0A3N4M902_9BACT|nr:tail fiber domain-containing protein [Chitinophaga barathri]
MLCAGQSYSQHVYQIRADSVRIYNVCDTAELIIENRTRGVAGYLYNKGNGRTEFRRIRLETVGNNQIAITGQDTLNLSSLSGIGGVDTIYRSGDNILYVKKGVTYTINAPIVQPGSFVQNQFTSAQAGNLWLTGIVRGNNRLDVPKDGSNAFAVATTPHLLLQNAAGSRGAGLQLNGDANPGLATWLHNGTTWMKRLELLSNGDIINIGSAANLSFKSGTTIDFSRNGANYIAASDVAGYLNFITGGAATEELNAALTLGANKDATFRGQVSLTNIPAQSTTASNYLTSNGGVVSSRTPAQLLADIAAASSARSIIAGTGLTGGGNLTADRTISANFGTAAGTIAQGNDSRILNGQTAFGWGNHASAGYLTTATGDARYPLLTGSYANPSWLTSLAWGKITGAPASFPTSSNLSTVLTNGNTAVNNITLGAAGNTNAYTYRVLRNIGSAERDGFLSVSGNSAVGYGVMIANNTGATSRALYVPDAGNSAYFSPNGSINMYEMWHSSNHPAGIANNSALTGASVYSNIVTNSAGHLSALTTRTLAPSDIGAVRSTAPANTTWNAFNGTTTAAFNESNTNAPTGVAYFGLNIPSLDATFGAQLAFRSGTGYFRTLEAGAYGSWMQLADRAWVSGNFVPTSGSGNYIQNQNVSAQAATFRLNGAAVMQKDGLATLLPSFLLYNAAGTRGANFQLNGEATPGFDTWLHNGTSWIKRGSWNATGGHLTIYGDAGEALNLTRLVNSVSGATGGLRFNALNSSSAEVSYAQIWGIIAGNTAGSETGHLGFNTRNAGVVGEKMRLTNTGNLLIGTATDDGSNKLQVQGGIKALNGNIISTNGTVNGTLTHSATEVILGAVSNHDVVVRTNNINRVRINTAGTFEIANIPAQATAGTLFLTSNAGVVNSRTAAQVLTDLGAAPLTGSGNYLRNQFSAVQTADAWITGSLRADTRLLSPELLGVGAGGASVIGNSTTGALQLIGGATGATSGRGAQINLYAGGHTTGLGAMTFFTGSGSGGTIQPERMRITPSGAVGIGTANPLFDLHVQSATANGIAIQNTIAMATTSGAFMRMYNSGVPSAVDHRLGGLLWGANTTGSTYAVGAQVQAAAEGAWTSGTSHPTYISFQTVSTGIALSEKLRLNSTGMIVTGSARINNGGINVPTGGLTLGSTANTTAYNLDIIRNISSVNYTARLNIGAAGQAVLTASNGTAASDKSIYLNFSGDPAYSPNGGTTQHTLWHAGNQPVATTGTANTLAKRDASGAVYATGFYQSSMAALKDNIEDFTAPALPLINGLAIKQFTYKADRGNNIHFGIIADNSDWHFSTKDHDRFDTNSSLAITIKAMQELSQENERLKEQAKSMEERLSKLEKLVEQLSDK